uniref:Restriction endonuclease type IV Mrr domain-containing protein n=1 Tax=Arcella intermedia TaxID=1963864 RepID=A0A6B2LN02_9EUKA
MNAMGLSLERTGTKGDGGIDFRGFWTLPRHPKQHQPDATRIKVVGQCKCESKKLPIKYIRELSGSIETEQQDSRTSTPILGIMVTHSEWTQNAVSQMNGSQFPILLCHLEDEGIANVLLNERAKQLLPQVVFAKKYDGHYSKHQIVFLYQKEL